jgi:23S rRNA-intervening sequence protein
LSYINLEIWQAARSLVIDIHKMTMEKLPRFELYEEGSQIRKSSKILPLTKASSEKPDARGSIPEATRKSTWL